MHGLLLVRSVLDLEDKVTGPVEDLVSHRIETLKSMKGSRRENR